MCMQGYQEGGGAKGALVLSPVWAPGKVYRGPLQLLFVCDVAKHCQCTAIYITGNSMIITSSTCAMCHGILLSLHFTILFIYALYAKAPPFFFYSSLHSVVS